MDYVENCNIDTYIHTLLICMYSVMAPIYEMAAMTLDGSPRWAGIWIRRESCELGLKNFPYPRMVGMCGNFTCRYCKG